MEKNNCQNYSLLDFFNIPYHVSTGKKEDKVIERGEELKNLPTPKYIEIQLSLFGDVNK